MVSLAMAYLLILFGKKPCDAACEKEEIERTISVEDEVPELFYAPSGQRTHISRTCRDSMDFGLCRSK